jgi:hypothetical protein
MILVVLVSALALAAPPGCSPLDEAGLRALVAEAKAAVDRDDLVSYAERRKRLYQDLPCLEIPLPADVWARFLLDEAVVAYALGQRWEAPLGTALSLDPALPRGDLPPELRAWIPPAPAASAAPLASGAFRIDGRSVSAAPVPVGTDLVGTHVVQRELDGELTTRVLQDEPFPADWRAEPLPEPVPATSSSPPAPVAPRGRGRPPLVATGAVMALVGSAVGVGTWAVRGSVHDADAADRLVLANAGGWTVAALGAVLGGVGLAVAAPEPAAARTLTLHAQGRF